MVAQKTLIRKKYLEAFEADNYGSLPDPIYARHFLKQFAEAINSDPQYFLSRFDEECGSCSAISDKMRTPRQKVRRMFMMHWRAILGRTFISVAALCIIAYIGMQIYQMMSPPPLIVDSPYGDIQTIAMSVEVSGQTEEEVQIFINKENVLTDATGRFSMTVALVKGINTIEIRAQKKYGRPNIVTRSIFVEDIHR